MSKQSDLVSVSQGASGDPLYIDTTNDRVGIGTTSPVDTFHAVGSDGATSRTTYQGATEFIFENNGDFSIDLSTGNANQAFINWHDTDAVQQGWLSYNHNGDYMRFGANGAERMRIDSSGGVAVANTRPTTDFDVGGRNMVIGSGSGDQGITIYSSSSGAGNIWFADGGGSTEEIVGGITYDHSGNFLKVRTNNSERMRIDSSGNVLINTTTIVDANGAQLVNNYAYPKTGAEFRSNATSTHSAFIFRNPNGAVGAINTSGSSTSYNTSSDYRLKENVTPLEGAADRLAQIPVHRFNFIADPDTTVDGFLAHEVQAFVPEAITGEHDGVDADGNPVYQGIDQSKLVPLLTAALQEALQKIDALEARVAALEAV